MKAERTNAERLQCGRWDEERMKKVIVIGCPGSGKSWFSKELHRQTGIPLYHLDRMYWNADRTTVEKRVFLERLSAVLEEDEWIVDGNYGATMELRMAACDTVILLDYPLDVCLDGVRQRIGRPHEDLPWIEVGEDAEFLEFIKCFHAKQRPQIMELLEKHSDKNRLIFTSREQADAFLRG